MRIVNNKLDKLCPNSR